MTETDTDGPLGALRDGVASTVAQWREAGRFTPSCDAWLRGYDLEFSRHLGEQGWLGITWPTEFGGSARSNRARLVVTEELLRAGAPVAAHWIGERQIGPAILRYGSTALQREFLPRIARGEVTFCLGMSETESGSDLASVRTTARRGDSGWVLNGRKIWTSQAHRSTHVYVLARTSTGERKQEGLSEFLVDLDSPGIEVRPILDLSGEHHFNEVTFDDVVVPDEYLLGEVGNGWAQVTEQLAFERGGMERVLSTYPLLEAVLETLAAGDDADQGTLELLGHAMARLCTLRNLAWNIATAMDDGDAPVEQAAMLKELGNAFEADVNEFARQVLDDEADPSQQGSMGLLAQGILAAPGFSIRGGTTEVLRTIIARNAAGGSPRSTREDSDALREVVDEVLEDAGGEVEGPGSPVWATIEQLGWTGVGIDESRGGAGGNLLHLCTIMEGIGRSAAPVPFLATTVAGHLLAGGGHPMPEGPATVVLPRSGEVVRLHRGDGVAHRLHGTASRVPWAQDAQLLVVCATDEQGDEAVVCVPAAAPGLLVEPGSNLAGEPRDTVHLDDVAIEEAMVVRGAMARRDIERLASLLTAAGVVGALGRVYDSTRQHVSEREQFGRPLFAFQAVAHGLAAIASQLTLARVALDAAILAEEQGADADRQVAIARVITGTAATQIARTAHQLHGAMGVTREHPLHLGTRRLWAWRDEWGTQRRWSTTLGRSFAGAGGAHAWEWLTALTDTVRDA